MLSVIHPCKMWIEESIKNVQKTLNCSFSKSYEQGSQNFMEAFPFNPTALGQNIQNYIVGNMWQCNNTCKQMQEQLTEKTSANIGLAISKFHYSKRISILW